MSEPLERFGKKSCMPPDPNTKQPTFKLPALSCDAHCHVFGPHEIFPYHPSSSYFPPDGGKENLKKLHDILGIERAVIVQASCHGPDNRAMLDAIKSNPENYRGVCLANDDFTQNDFIDLQKNGVRGIRYNFVKHLGGRPDTDKMLKTLEIVKQLGWHLVVHVGGADLIDLKDFFEKIEMEIVVDHMGRVPTENGMEQEAFQILCHFMQNDNWWVKICGAERISKAGPPFHDAMPYAQKLTQIAPDRILWGTDWPHPNIKTHMPNDGDLVNLIPLLTTGDDALIKKILVDNPARLYGWI